MPPGAEYLTRGPIHEAFAEPVVFNPTSSVIVPKPPPDGLVNEIPPDQKPTGADVEWIPGYWAWDDQRTDYIWISGVWRDIPPGRQWVPGYWSATQGGFGWTAGFWAPAQPVGPIDYLPPPPASLEAGPNSPEPGPDFAWNPGSWIWSTDQYRWQPGYWYQAQPDWVWSPATYQMTPSGAIYNQGYWDYSLQRRGVQFAPLGFNGGGFNGGGLNGGGLNGIGLNGGGFNDGGLNGVGFNGGGLNGGGLNQPFSYTPSLVLPVAGLLANLFVRPNSGRYYYGDYYNAAGVGGNGGYVPWFNFRNNKIGYDPFYSSLNALNRNQPNWDQHYREGFRERFENQGARPLPTYAAQRSLIDERRGRGEEVRNLGFAQPLNQWARNPNSSQQFVPVGAEHREELLRRQGDLHRLQQVRVQQEERGRLAEANRNLRIEEARRPIFRNEMPRSPIAAAEHARFESRGLSQAPPHPPGQNPFRAEYGPHRPEVPVISHRTPEVPRATNHPEPHPHPERPREGRREERPREAQREERPR